MFVSAYAVDYTKQKAKADSEWNIKAAVEQACRAAMFELDHPGCIFPVPWADDVDRMESEISNDPE